MKVWPNSKLLQHPIFTRSVLLPDLRFVPYRYATRSPERAASPATYWLISKALIAPEVVLGVAVGVGVGVEALEDVTEAEAVVEGLTEEDEDGDGEGATVLLFEGFEDVYFYVSVDHKFNSC
jgi:hypothetical protein